MAKDDEGAAPLDGAALRELAQAADEALARRLKADASVAPRAPLFAVRSPPNDTKPS